MNTMNKNETGRHDSEQPKIKTKDRPIWELLEILLNTVENLPTKSDFNLLVHPGLCSIIEKLSNTIFSKSESKVLYDYVYNNAKTEFRDTQHGLEVYRTRKWNMGGRDNKNVVYYWPSGDMNARIEWLRKKILLEKTKANYTLWKDQS
jgi:hypothetical protein